MSAPPINIFLNLTSLSPSKMEHFLPRIFRPLFVDHYFREKDKSNMLVIKVGIMESKRRKRKSKKKKKKTCNVKGCSDKKKKSLPTNKIKEKTDLKIKEGTGKNSYLCKEHYKEYKKQTEEERTAKRLSWN